MNRTISQENLQKYRKEQPFTHVPTIEEWLVYWLNTHMRPTCKLNTYANFHSYIYSHILPVIGDYLLNTISTVELQYYVDFKLEEGRLDGKGGLSLKTVKEHIGLLNNAFKKAISLQILTYNPVQNIIFPKLHQVEIKVFTVEEQETMNEHIEPTYQANSLIPVLLGQYAGLRIGEISALRIQDIDLEKRMICIDESLNRIPIFLDDSTIQYQLIYGTTKSNKIRYIPMNEDIYQALTIFFTTMPSHIKQECTHPLFINQKGNVMEPQNIAYHFHKLLKQVSIKGYHFHCLRHTFATRALELNMDMKSCSNMLGHATTQFTIDRYAHISYQHLTNQIKKMSNSTILTI